MIHDWWLVTQPDEEQSLKLIPRAVRDKLDRVQIKLHLKEWQALTLAERQRLCDLPCSGTEDVRRYAAEVNGLVQRVTGKPAEQVDRS